MSGIVDVMKTSNRVDRLEKKLATSFKISCKRQDSLEKELLELNIFLISIEKELLELKKDTHTHTMYAGTAVPITKEDAEGGSW